MRRGGGGYGSCDPPCPLKFSEIEISNKDAKNKTKKTKTKTKQKQRERKGEGKCLRLSIFCVHTSLQRILTYFFKNNFCLIPHPTPSFTPQKPHFVKNFWIHPRHDHIFIKLQLSHPPHLLLSTKKLSKFSECVHYICAATIITISYGSLLVG